MTFRGFFSWIYKKVEIHVANKEEGSRESLEVSSHSACHLNGCKGQHMIYTYNVDTKDLAGGLLDLLQLTVRLLA